MNSLDLVRLIPLMKLTSGRPEITIGLIDGPVALDHPDLRTESIREIPGKWQGACAMINSSACMHGTFVAGILFAKRGNVVPAICPNCTLIVRPIFDETTSTYGQIPSATPQELAVAIIDCVDAGARVLNMSVALINPSPNGERELDEALRYANQHEVIIIAAAGNQGMLGSTVITRHPWIIPVVAYDMSGRPMGESNLGSSIGRRGLGAPGQAITSLSTDGKPLTLSGTSAATPFVTGTVALLWSDFPTINAALIKYAMVQPPSQNRTSVVPPLLDAWRAHEILNTGRYRK